MCISEKYVCRINVSFNYEMSDSHRDRWAIGIRNFRPKWCKAVALDPVRPRKFIPLIVVLSPSCPRSRNFAPLENLSDSDPIRAALVRLTGYRWMEFPEWVFWTRAVYGEIKASLRVYETIHTPIYIIPRQKYAARGPNIARISGRCAYIRFFFVYM